MFRWGQAIVLILVMAAIVAGFSYLSTFDFFRSVDKGMFGALVGAAGTILAGWLIWAQTRDQIQASEKAQVANEERQEQNQLQTLRQEINYIHSAATYLDRFLSPFEGATNNGADYRVRLFQMANRGEIIFPHLAGNQVAVVFNALVATHSRLANLSGSIQQAIGAPDSSTRLAAIDDATRINVEEMRKLRHSLDLEVHGREGAIERIRYE